MEDMPKMIKFLDDTRKPSFEKLDFVLVAKTMKTNAANRQTDD